ncbi:MAG: ubiquitin-like domain-containing protein [Microlunatus sp.]|nr:ubiquitin-like domain-containing protein [Microlunatus sp.]MDN5770108.1 ubiquitin-like domain-containing protein [Microlunatus sp.]
MRKIIPVVAAGATALLVAGASFSYAVMDKDVRLSVDGSRRDVSTMVGTVGQVLEKEGIEVGEHDVVAPSPDTQLVDGTSIAVQFGRQVTITVDGAPRTFWTTATTVDQALQSRRIGLNSGDHVSTSRSSAIGRDGMSFAVSTQKTVTLDNAGKKQQLKTTAQTVGDALVVARIAVDADDVVSADPSSRLTDGATVRYTRVDKKSVTKRSKVDFDTTYKNSSRLDRGQTKVRHKGAAGVRTSVFTEIRHNGKLVSRHKTRSAVTTKPKNEVVLRGTRETSVLDGGKPAKVGDGGGRRSQIFVTGYTYWDNSPPGSAQIARPQIHDRAGGAGTWKDPVTVAVQSGRFSFGTRFYLPELKKYFIVEDLCGACNDGRGGGAYTLDIWLDGSHLSSGGAESCAARVTGLQSAIEDPRSNLPVDSGSVC